MVGSFFAVLALAFMLLLGGARAGEEVLPMRAATQDGRAVVDMTRVRIDRNPDRREDPVGRASSPAVPDGVEFVGWQDACVRLPVMIGGEPLEVEAGGGFALARPLTARPAADGDTFLEILVRELALK